MTNIQSTCAGYNPTPPAPGNISVTQNGTVLVVDGVTGTIDLVTGAFTVQEDLTGSADCPVGYTCTSTTTGTFTMGQDPMTFTGSTRVDISYSGSPLCAVTYDVSGTRVSCAAPATLSGGRWAPILRMLTSQSRAPSALSPGDPWVPILWMLTDR